MHGFEDELPTLLHHPLIPYFQNCLSALTTLEHCSWFEANAGGLYEKVRINRVWLHPTQGTSLFVNRLYPHPLTHPDPQIETRTK